MVMMSEAAGAWDFGEGDFGDRDFGDENGGDGTGATSAWSCANAPVLGANVPIAKAPIASVPGVNNADATVARHPRPHTKRRGLPLARLRPLNTIFHPCRLPYTPTA